MKDVLLVIPGHLGKDSGATASYDGGGTVSISVEERYVNLQQAIGLCLAHSVSPLKASKKVVLALPRQQGIEFYKNGLINVYVHDREYFGLTDRVALANDIDADVIELHSNSAEFSASGFEVLCYSENSNGVESKSYILSRNVMRSVKDNLNFKIRRIATSVDKDGNLVGRDLYILKNTRNSAIITESAFMSDPNEIKLLDVDLDGFNEQMGAAIWLGYQRTVLEEKS